MKKSYWLLFEKSDETRVANSIDSYNDTTGFVYNYDSHVPNHKNIYSNDIVIIRKENAIDGWGVIDSIKSKNDVQKTLRRCPSCNSTDIRTRKTKAPHWKCGACSHEFKNEIITTTEVTTFEAKIVNYSKLGKAYSVESIKNCAQRGSSSSQLSMMELDPIKLSKTIDIGGSESYETTDMSMKVYGRGQGRGLSQELKKAVELQAMQLAREWYENKGWKVEDVSSTHPYDLQAEKEDEVRCIEVKGTTGLGKSIFLTKNEVTQAKAFPNRAALVVVSKIELSDIETQKVQGGEISCHFDKWVIDENSLFPIQYTYFLKDN